MAINLDDILSRLNAQTKSKNVTNRRPYDGYDGGDQPEYGEKDGESVEGYDKNKFIPKDLWTANFLYSNDEFKYGTRDDTLGTDKNRYNEVNCNALIQWTMRYQGIGMVTPVGEIEFNLAAQFAIRHFLNDWDTSPSNECGYMVSDLDILIRYNPDFKAVETEYGKEATTPYEIDTDKLLEWMKRYVGIGIFPEFSAQLVIRHLRGDWNKYHGDLTENMAVELLQYWQSQNSSTIGSMF